MAQQTLVTYTCDMPHTAGVGNNRHPVEVEAEQPPVEFTMEGKPLIIDLCAEHKQKFGTATGPFVEHARRDTAQHNGFPARRPGRNAPSRKRASAIRTWAKDHGHKISERGRIPAPIVAEYERSH